ncbi:hypothetical protein RKE29_04025 [Streptomyces sp. B1866]|uniref:TRAFAC clade GTPase domain-containing protein n=1 Tax=Streptomyces sp. B1866 TaxID=3075431 RepID=UPI00288FAAB4|nr:hypothetical protein [Streptomyces sp. B1866]MDT3395818.1 hypothetical protein [Streptomyces sp. B1866]
MNGRPAARAYPEVRCPYCLDPVTYDESRLYVRNVQQELEPLDLSAERNPLRREDLLRGAHQLCPHTGGVPPHYLPVSFLVHGRPLTVAMIGSSTAGKTHLLASILGEVESGALRPYGLACRPLDPEWHRRFLRQQVQPLHDAQVLAATASTAFAYFADGLLVSGHGGTRPVMFFDLAGEDLVEHGEAARFLTGVDAFIFLIDPLRALRLPQLDRVREKTGLRERDLGDEAFATVLDRVPRTGRYIDGAAAAVVLNKSDLVRFDPPVDRWLSRPLPPAVSGHELYEESRDVYAFVRHHGSPAWLKPFTECLRCTLHFVSATGGREQGGVFPYGVVPRRVLAPLLSIFAMCGLLPGEDLREAGLA